MIVDVHHHWLPEAHVRHFERYMGTAEEARRTEDRVTLYRDGLPVFPNIPPEMYDTERQIALMDAAGIGVAVLHTALWPEWCDLAMCREVNDGIAQAVRRYPERLVGLAHVPVGEEGAMRELERAVRDLGFRGVAVNTHVHRLQLPLDARPFWPFWQKVAELDVPVVVHPSALPLEYRMIKDYDLHRTLGRLQDMVAASARLVYSGLFDEFPNLRFIMGHMGGGFYAVAERVLGVYTFHPHNPTSTAGAHLAKLYVDTAPPFWPRTSVSAAVETLGDGNVMLGSDFPIGVSWLDRAVAMIRDMGFAPDITQRIMGDNAAALFKLAGED